MPLPEVAGDLMFGEMHSHFVPAAGTNVEFTSQGPERTLASSSSGGGLFGRPMTRKGHGALLNLGLAFSSSRRVPGAPFLVGCPISRVLCEKWDRVR
jgi:hypothetical protein